MRMIALLSGGLDSTVALTMVLRKEPIEPGLALTFDYGQIAAQGEIRAACAIAGRFHLEHRVIDLPFLAEVASGPLVGKGEADLPRPGESGIEEAAETAKEAARAVWIPHRNGVFLAVAAAFADAAGAPRTSS